MSTSLELLKKQIALGNQKHDGYNFTEHIDIASLKLQLDTTFWNCEFQDGFSAVGLDSEIKLTFSECTSSKAVSFEKVNITQLDFQRCTFVAGLKMDQLHSQGVTIDRCTVDKGCQLIEPLVSSFFYNKNYSEWESIPNN